MKELKKEEKIICPSKYTVWNSTKEREFIVDDEWLDSIPRKGIYRLELFNYGEGLEVTYRNGRRVYYNNCHGTWGMAAEFV